MATSSMSTAASPPASEGFAIVVMGVSGSGKTTVGVRLAKTLGAEFIDGDDLHTDAARAKMKSGHPLTDEDRWPWLDRIGAELAQGERTVVACSALRRAYRDRLRAAAGPKLRFVYLEATPEEMRARDCFAFGPQPHFARRPSDHGRLAQLPQLAVSFAFFRVRSGRK